MGTEIYSDYYYGLSEDEEKKLFQEIVDMAVKFMRENYDRSVPVHNFRTPEQLSQEIDLKTPADGKGMADVLPSLQKVVKYAVRTGHVRFFNQLWAGTDKPAVVAEWLTAVLNSSMYTFEIAPVFTLMELECLNVWKNFIGWNGDGVFAPGGAHCNLLAILAARNAFSDDIKKKGLFQHKPLVCFTSTHSHYTIQRACSVIGIGMDGVVEVDVDQEGKMDIKDLNHKIQEEINRGNSPFMISATSGTTVYGAYDDLNAIADVAQKFNLWFHVDAAWGGHCLFSDKHRHLMKGCERANSVTLTSTKCFGLPQQCACVLMKAKNVLTQCNQMNEDYLFHDVEEKEYDLGEKTLNCGRRVDAFKMWTSLQVHGLKGFQEIVDHAFDMAALLASAIRDQPDKFRLVHTPTSLNVCFFFIPPSARDKDETTKQDAMGACTAVIRRKMQVEGKILFNYSDMKGIKGHFFRAITCNPYATPKDILFMLEEVERLGNTL